MVGRCVEFDSGEEVEMKVEEETPLMKLFALVSDAAELYGSGLSGSTPKVSR